MHVITLHRHWHAHPHLIERLKVLVAAYLGNLVVDLMMPLNLMLKPASAAPFKAPLHHW